MLSYGKQNHATITTTWEIIEETYIIGGEIAKQDNNKEIIFIWGASLGEHLGASEDFRELERVFQSDYHYINKRQIYHVL